MEQFELGPLEEYSFLARDYQTIKMREPLAPAWMVGAHIEWNDQYSNPPYLWIHMADGSKLDLTKLVYRQHSSWYVAETGDGRMNSLWHTGSVSYVDLKVWQASDGTCTQWAKPGDGGWITKKARATTQQDGFGQAHSWLMMEDGEYTVLRGPWDTQPPLGYEEVYERYVDGSGFKGEVSREAFVTAVQLFCPEAKTYLVHSRKNGLAVEPRLQIARAEWIAPKAIHLDIRRRLKEKLSDDANLK